MLRCFTVNTVTLVYNGSHGSFVCLVFMSKLLGCRITSSSGLGTAILPSSESTEIL